MKSWWDLGEWIGQAGEKFTENQITCPFCSEKGKFELEYHAEKKKPNGHKKLNFDTYKCANCAGYVQALWSANEYGGSRGIHDYRVQPWPIGKAKPSDNWPAEVSRFWTQAHDSERNGNLDAATVMARSALQVALRERGAIGNSLKEEIEDLANKGVLPKIIREWADEVRLIANESAHPTTGDDEPDKVDVSDIVKYLDYLLMYLYDLPHDIGEFRKRKRK